MKFANTAELGNFISKQKLFTGFIGLQEIYQGGSSYNFKVMTYVNGQNSTYFLKLLKDYNEYTALKKIISLVNPNSLINIPTEKFQQYYLLALKFIDGHKLRYQDCNKTVIKNLLADYQKITHTKFPENLVKPQVETVYEADNITQYLNHNKHWTWHLINCYFWKNFIRQIQLPDWPRQVIHGDLTANNILIDKNTYPHLLDFGRLRYGYICEDIAELVCQLSGFRGLFGNLKRFKKLYGSINKLFPEINKQMWLYGVQFFYLMIISRHIRNKGKCLNIRKNICLLIKLMNYTRLYRFLQKQD